MKTDKQEPFLYHKTMQQIKEYRKKPVGLKLSWLQAQMEFFYFAIPEKTKEIGNKLIKGEGK